MSDEPSSSFHNLGISLFEGNEGPYVHTIHEMVVLIRLVVAMSHMWLKSDTVALRASRWGWA